MGELQSINFTMRPILPLALVILTNCIQAENIPAPKPKISGLYYWTPSAIFARLKDAKQSRNKKERSHLDWTPTCPDGCVSEGTCYPVLACAPDFHQCNSRCDSSSGYPCDAQECAQTTHYCQRAALEGFDCASNLPADYLQCSPGCLDSHTCYPNSCAVEYGQCNCDQGTCDQDWCYRTPGSGYCDRHVCRTEQGVIVKNETEELGFLALLIVIYIYVMLFTCCFCCCCCCQGWTWFGCRPEKNQGFTHNVVTTGPPVYPTQMQAVPQPIIQPVMMPMMQPMMQPQQAAQPINITIVNNNDNDNKSETSFKGHHGEEH